ncbi:hypothetical protein ONE63_011028 [Megalurothrips usitatus]|uniref:Cell cycle checkpoint control protein RAD9A n=1 Tax=Megalurothrips usitatus TaxID=439358 RepID=A0AAV7XLD2_9NEOP|nr:hypothetical protein ONE63_011028 [Megalurothrips usitatus]
MVCVVPKQNVEILGRALHALARIGDELYLEPVNEGLTFRTVHSNHSVYAEVHFNGQFFSFYNCPPPSTNEGEDDALKCRINMKSYLAAFRSLACIRKQVETCLLEIEPRWLMIKFRCHHGLIRTYKLPVIETETLQALYTVDEVPNHLVIGANVLAAAVKNFQLSERDITLVVEERLAILRNYVPGGADPAGVIRSELKLESGEFDSYTVRQQTAITFCLKSFRSVLFFSEPTNLSLAVKFSSPGSPVVIICDSPTVELRFVLSSLAPENCDTTRTDSQQLLTPLPSFEGRVKEKVQVTKKTPAANKQVCTLDEAWEGTGSNQSTSSNSRQNHKTVKKPSLETNTTTHRGVSSRGSNGSTEPPLCSGVSQRSASSATSSTRAVVGTSTSSVPYSKHNHAESFASLLRRANTEDSEQNDIIIPQSPEAENVNEEEDDDVVPASPPPVKKARIFFQRCFDRTLHRGDFDAGEVYVPDTDEED